MTGSAGQKRVPKNHVIEYVCGLPPQKEKHQIVSKVNQLIQLCDELEEEG
jgi:type I restriction enzyme, S subunit